MFKVIGKDGKEYGPTTAEEIRTWIAQGRLDAESKVRPESVPEWRALRELPEFRGAFPGSPAVAAGSPAVGASRTSGLAVASLVLGVLGTVTFGFTAIVGLILGIVALVKINKSQGQLSGLGLAIAGVALSGLMIMMLPIMFAMLLPAVARAKSKAQTIQCMSNVKQLNLALIMYASDHNDTFPPGDKWCDLIKPYLGGADRAFECPAEQHGTGRCSYALNANLANHKISDVGAPARTVLVFSSLEGWNQAGGIDLARPHEHARNSVTVGFADGHAETTSPGRSTSLKW